ncbi:MAG: hypothetical protein BRD49_03520 [Bacteroidetes bacterium SW_10_40_5]|nr:MAG: hypothetical protein BRD49_03520 [Bacteroidetes bacterium SW_10_40_5]
MWEDLGRDTAIGNTMSGRITVNNVSNFSPFPFGSGSSTSNPLPVELTDFTGQKIEGQVKLIWQTASEQNASHFIVQRSTNEDQFEKIGRVNAQGTTTDPTQYRLLDKNPAQTN